MSIFASGPTLAELGDHARRTVKHYRETIGGDLTRKPIGEAYETDSQIVICGIPQDDDSHNCDQMGCGSVHVIYRFRKP